MENIPSMMQENVQTDWTQKGNSERHWHSSRLERYYYFDHVKLHVVGGVEN